AGRGGAGGAGAMPARPPHGVAGARSRSAARGACANIVLMAHRNGIIVAALVCGSLAVGQNAATSPAAAATQRIIPAQGNTALTGAIMQRLTDDPVLGTITINVGENGAVSLNGVVPTQALADRAVEVVKTVPGVSSVSSQILVNQDPFAPAAPTPTGPMPPITSAPPPPRAAAEPQALLNDAFEKQPSLARVSAHIYADEVLLYGTVTSDGVKKQAEQIVRQIAPKLPLNDIIW